jgi:hypothetical protein
LGTNVSQHADSCQECLDLHKTGPRVVPVCLQAVPMLTANIFPNIIRVIHTIIDVMRQNIRNISDIHGWIFLCSDLVKEEETERYFIIVKRLLLISLSLPLCLSFSFACLCLFVCVRVCLCVCMCVLVCAHNHAHAAVKFISKRCGTEQLTETTLAAGTAMRMWWR